MSSRNMCLLPRATLHSDSEQLDPHVAPFLRLTAGLRENLTVAPCVGNLHVCRLPS
jgi:hypothetical protein